MLHLVRFKKVGWLQPDFRDCSIAASAEVEKRCREARATHTLLVLEVEPELAVPWTRPDDLPFNSKEPLVAVGKLPKDGLWGGFADGAVRKIKPDITPEVFRRILTSSGREVIQLEREVELR